MYLVSFPDNPVTTPRSWAAINITINIIGHRSDHGWMLLSSAFAVLVFPGGRFLLTDQLNLITPRSHASGSEHLEMSRPFPDKKKCH